MAAKWLPVACAIAMATWSNYSTKKIGNAAVAVFSKHFEIVDEVCNVLDLSDITDIANVKNSDLAIEELKISTFIDLMKIDGDVDDKEIDFIENFIDKSNLDSATKMGLISQIHSKEKIKVNFSTLNIDYEEKLYFFIDLISLAKADGKFDITEKMYIKEIGKQFDFDKNDIAELMLSE
ncbi:tellurite resistance TerB family protein [Shewanella sp.]|uniref:tellurite resistance TerB family protein n=1 Tax=Shewanella sp. TaxID=50422 RepID=UPI0040485ADE